MTKAIKTRDTLLAEARLAFWTRGYSNVSLRDISGAAGVDVALISRYFGGKLGLFNATLEGAFIWPELLDATGGDPVDVAIGKFSMDAIDPHKASIIQLILMNAADPEVGPVVNKIMCDDFFNPLLARMGGAEHTINVSMFTAIVLGSFVARQHLQLPGITELSQPDYADVLRHLITAALNYKQ